MAYSSDCTFFIESEELCPRPTLSAREITRFITQNRHEVVSNELSRLACEEYLDDIMQHVHQMENETLPDVIFIEMQHEIQWYMRPYLIDFLIEAHAAFDLLPDTLFLTVNLLDRYCSRRTVYKQHYQLVGCAALLIASKYGDKKDRVPQILELSNMCCGQYEADMFTQMEMHVLNTLEWTVGHPTINFFAKLIAADEGDCREVEHMAAYVSEIAMFHRDFVSTRPSTMARASLALARAILGRSDPNMARTDPDWNRDDNMTLLLLSKHLHQPSAILSKKYASVRLSNSSARLADFMAYQRAMARRAALPPTPPSSQISPPLLAVKYGDVMCTPQKGLGAVPGIANGYLTPPITPESTFFGANPAKDPYASCPVTPTPQQSQPYHHAFRPTQSRYEHNHYSACVPTSTLTSSYMGP